MTTEEINDILIKYNKLIIKNVNKVNINKRFLAIKCIQIEDIIQEVRIKLFILLRDVYDDRFDLENFVTYQAAWNTKKIYNNIVRSSSCFFGTSRKRGSRGGSKQSIIDYNKEPIDKYLHNTHRKDALNRKDPMPECLLNMEFEKAGSNIDYEFLVDEVIKRLTADYNKPTYKESDYELLKDIYINIFIMLLNEEIHLHYNQTKDENTCSFLAKKFNYTPAGIRTIINKIKVIILDVIKEYNK